MSTASPLRILIIDDDPVVSELLEALLGLEGHRVTVADSGEAAFSHLEIQKEPLDVILTDMQLPGLQSAALAASLRPMLTPGCVLLGMSGSDPTPAEREACDAFLRKPFTVEDFTRAVEEAAHGIKRSPPSAKPATNSTDAALDESIFSRMQKQLPAAALGELYQLTIDDALMRLDRMIASEAAGDEDAVRREAHAIKGGSGMVGASELHRLAARVEEGSPGDTPPLADLVAACARLRRMLDARL